MVGRGVAVGLGRGAVVGVGVGAAVGGTGTGEAVGPGVGLGLGQAVGAVVLGSVGPAVGAPADVELDDGVEPGGQMSGAEELGSGDHSGANVGEGPDRHPAARVAAARRTTVSFGHGRGRTPQSARHGCPNAAEVPIGSQDAPYGKTVVLGPDLRPLRSAENAQSARGPGSSYGVTVKLRLTGAAAL